jgi:cellulose synthase (UDP-forming)
MAALVAASVVGVVRMSTGHANAPGTLFNLLWVAFDLAIFSVIIKAVRYRGFDPAAEEPPTIIRARRGAA